MGPREFYDELPSTQDRALELARSGAEDGTRVVASRQSRGRGRADHLWSSPDGGLYVSIVLKAVPGPVPFLPLGIGATLARTLGEAYALPLRTKWPNDVLLPARGAVARKLAGILVDEIPSPNLGRAWVVGVGVNVLAPPGGYPSDLLRPATSLSELTSPAPTLAEVERLVVDSCLQTRRTLEREDGATVMLRHCRALLYGVGCRVVVDGRPAGRISGLADDGALEVGTEGAPTWVRSGDVAIQEEA